jgi:hypothetical protein
MPESPRSNGPSPCRIVFAQIVGWVIAVALTAGPQIEYLRALSKEGIGPLGWLFGMGLDSTLFFVVLLAGPLFWFWPRFSVAVDSAKSSPTATWFGAATKPTRPDDRADTRAWVLAIAVGIASLVASVSISNRDVGGQLHLRFGDLPPAYHDEFSYLLQAKTFLDGRLSYPSHPTAPELFDQMHVVNEGRFASRYFPGTGAWMAPFLAFGHPYVGHWLAGAIAAMFTFWAGRELGGNGVGFLAGALTALSPGVALFSNLLLAHQPTLAGLSLFVFLFLRMQRTEHVLDFVGCGCGLAFAMLCRPMTAAGVGLPFGLWQLAWLTGGASATQNTLNLAARLRRTVALGLPLLAGMLILLVYNSTITGSALTSPYQLYTDTYTPRHVYGFNNVARGEKHVGPKVIENYDNWAENLTPKLALRNTRDRFVASTHWTLSLPLLAAAGAAFFLLFPGRDRRWLLIATGIISLFAVHIPYWFVGIMNWHYVFEAAPLWLILFAGVTQWLCDAWRQSGQRLLPIWWGSLVALSLLIAWTAYEPGTLRFAVDEVAYARIGYWKFDRMIDELSSQSAKPILLLIEGDPADKSIDYVTNDPDLSGRVLRGRFRPGNTQLDEVAGQFPDRSIWLYRVKPQGLTRVATAQK